jgi:Histidine kinase-, DNA gyrase B-, and HSP90-like ATPase
MNTEKNPQEEKDPNIIDASPTKDLFVTMLVRDLILSDAISDLVDNCVDGAKALRPDKNYKGLYVNIVANDKVFSIEDNCGGFSSQIARDYAFKFGRPSSAELTPYSVGQFGIGMKRALFKIGRLFNIGSTSKNSIFNIKFDVNNWLPDEKKWDLEFSSLEENLPDIPISKRGTGIRIEKLNPDVAKQFADPIFIASLIEQLSLQHMYNTDKGISISLNGHPLNAFNLKFKTSDELKSAYWSNPYKLEGGNVNVKILAGISDPELKYGGWYLFCNDRLILGPEQTAITGWSGKEVAGEGPKYHGQYQEFRGYVFFEAEKSQLLPWTTTKNSMDLDSDIFKSVKRQMIVLMKQVVYFLNARHEARKKIAEDEKLPVDQKVDNTVATAIANLSANNYSQSFTFPKVDVPVGTQSSEKVVKIAYDSKLNKVNKIKKALGVKTLREVGELTFDYYYDSEIGE